MITNEPASETTAAPPMLTASAAAKVRELIEAEGDPALALRLAVRPGGCSGFSYDMFFDTQVDDTDTVSETTIDYKEMGLQGSGFAITNPSQSRSYGCGQSFC